MCTRGNYYTLCVLWTLILYNKVNLLASACFRQFFLIFDSHICHDLIKGEEGSETVADACPGGCLHPISLMKTIKINVSGFRSSGFSR